MNPAIIRLIQHSVYGWLILYMVAVLFLGEAAWTNAPVDLFTTREGPLGLAQAWINGLGAISCAALCLVLLGGAIAQMGRHRMWLALVVWFLFRVVDQRLWLASNGGVQLMENMLFWAAFLGPATGAVLRSSAFWIARAQLLLVYAAAAAHKFTGAAWLDGSAVLRVANDPDFHLQWLMAVPGLSTALTYGALAFMTLFPIAVWWTPSRRIFLVLGMLFHLGTVVFMDIPQMGLAFIACYPIWMSEDDRSALVRLFLRTPFRVSRIAAD